MFISASIRTMLQKYFSKIDEVVIPCTFTYDQVDDLLKDLEKCLTKHKSFFENNESKSENVWRSYWQMEL